MSKNYWNLNKARVLKLFLIISFLLLLLCPIITIFAQVPTIFAPGIISGPAHDSAPAFSPDGKTVYFSRSNASGSTILDSRLERGKWSKPEVAPFSGKWDDLEPAMSPDGNFLIFISSRPADGNGKSLDGFFNGQSQPGHGGNLWRVNRIGDKWSEPVRLPDNINRSTAIYAPSVVGDGSLYFMEASGEKRRFRLFRSQLAGGVYQSPEFVSFSTGEATDVDPAVAPDESFAIFGSSRPPALGIDLFIVFRKNGVWSEPFHMGTEINSPGSDAEPRLSPNLKTVYFSSTRTMPITFPRTLESANQDLERIREWDNGNYNIWQFSLADWLKNHKNIR